MIRIGFAYNQKPEPAGLESTNEGAARTPAPADGESPRPEEEPPAIADEFAEWDSRETIDAVANALSALGEVIRLEATQDFPERLRQARPDIVFNIAEGTHGVNREAHVPAICEFYGIPYSGSDPATLSICLNKARTKELLAFHAVPTPRFSLLRDMSDLETLSGSLDFPLFIKPVHEGSSKGITERNFCRTSDELRGQTGFLLERYRQPVIVEEYLPGAEFTCAVLGNGSEKRILPIVAIAFDSLPDGALPIYGYEAKWIWDRPERPLRMFECPAPIDAALEAAIVKITSDAYDVLGCRDWSRIDVRLDAAGQPNIIEVNPLPGILPDPADNSCFPKAARAAGMSYDELIQTCLRLAAARQRVSLIRPIEEVRASKPARRNRQARKPVFGEAKGEIASQNRLTA